MIDTLLDACEVVMQTLGEPQSSYWLSSQVIEMKLWKASEADVEKALTADIQQRGESSRFMRFGEAKFGLRSWVT